LDEKLLGHLSRVSSFGLSGIVPAPRRTFHIDHSGPARYRHGQMLMQYGTGFNTTPQTGENA
jgi:hypothetical protein